MEKQSLGVRKGAWTKEEDVLLTKCIEKYGEGRWHLVPLRAGLNRCRKSCRLRWLNYLNPNVKRGFFNKDEVDLIVRMHKLLGNKWSLIAGRIPGRTANDVKNFWNTHINKKSSASHRPNKATIPESSIIRPQPRAFSCPLELLTSSETNLQAGIDIGDKNNDCDKSVLEGEGEEEEEECIRWWANLLQTSGNENGARVPFMFPEDEAQQPMVLSPGPRTQANNNATTD